MKSMERQSGLVMRKRNAERVRNVMAALFPITLIIFCIQQGETITWTDSDTGITVSCGTVVDPTSFQTLQPCQG